MKCYLRKKQLNYRSFDTLVGCCFFFFTHIDIEVYDKKCYGERYKVTWSFKCKWPYKFGWRKKQVFFLHVIFQNNFAECDFAWITACKLNTSKSQLYFAALILKKKKCYQKKIGEGHIACPFFCIRVSMRPERCTHPASGARTGRSPSLWRSPGTQRSWMKRCRTPGEREGERHFRMTRPRFLEGGRQNVVSGGEKRREVKGELERLPRRWHLI